MSSTPKSRRHIEKYFDFEDKVAAVNYYIDTMLNKTITMFKYNNLPSTLVERELELMLQTDGKCIVTDWEGDIVALDGNYAPPNDVYYRPAHFIVANPWAKINHEFELVNRYLVKTETAGEHKPAVLVRNDPLDRGLLPIIQKYGALLTEVDLTMYIASINFRALNAITANTDREFESGKAYLAALKDGKQGVMLEEEMSNGIKTQPYATSSQGYITQIIELEQYLRGTFLNEIGLNANYNMKRERLSANETELNEDCLRPLIDAMLEERQVAIDDINSQFGTNISVEFNSAWEKYNLSPLELEEMGEEEPIEITSDKEGVEDGGYIQTDENADETVDGGRQDEADAVDGEDEEKDGEETGEVSEEDGEVEPEQEPEVKVEVNIEIENAEEVSVEETDEPEEEPEDNPDESEEDEEENNDED